MAKVADGATTRKERMIEMMTYIRGFGQDGVGLYQVQLHMSLLHGLKFSTTERYVQELVLGKLLYVYGAKFYLDVSQFDRLMELIAPDVNPSLIISSRPMDLPDPDTHTHTRERPESEDSNDKDKKTKKKQRKRERKNRRREKGNG